MAAYQTSGFAFQGAGQFAFQGGAAVSQGNAGGWLFRDRYDQELLRRRRKKLEQQRLEAEAEQIKDKLDRDIAILLRQQEAKQAYEADLGRIRSLADQLSAQEANVQYGERVAKALERATIKGGFSALEALDRELRRSIEEEKFLIMAARILIEDNDA